jgi:hypothetical protein
MAERRKLGDAIKFSPEKIAFIEGKADERTQSPSQTTPGNFPEKTIDVKTVKSGEHSLATNEKPQRRNARFRQNRDFPAASEVLDQVLVPVTIRLQHRTSQALKRAYLEQKLRHAKPDTLQEIGEEAISDWLLRSGYLDH